MKISLDPTSTADEWTMLNDGSIAIPRAHDYHIDWVDPDGTRRSTPKMPLDWRRTTDASKQATIDSMQHTLDSLRKVTPPRTIQTPSGPRNILVQFDVIAPDKFPDYEPPIGPSAVRADLNNSLWIVPRTSADAAGGGLPYDVVNRKGEIMERVQFPKGRVLAGFGPGGVVYLNRVEEAWGFLKRARVK